MTARSQGRLPREEESRNCTVAFCTHTHTLTQTQSLACLVAANIAIVYHCCVTIYFLRDPRAIIFLFYFKILHVNWFLVLPRHKSLKFIQGERCLNVETIFGS